MIPTIKIFYRAQILNVGPYDNYHWRVTEETEDGDVIGIRAYGRASSQDVADDQARDALWAIKSNWTTISTEEEIIPGIQDTVPEGGHTIINTRRGRVTKL